MDWLSNTHIDRRLLKLGGLSCFAGSGIVIALIGLSNDPGLRILLGCIAAICAASGMIFLGLVHTLDAMRLVKEAGRRLEVGEFEAAIPMLNRAIAIRPRLVGAYLSRSAAYVGVGQFSLALRDADRAIHIAPYLPEARLTRARLNSHRGLHAQAIRDLQVGIAEKPDWATGYMEMARLQIKMGEYEHGLATLRTLDENISSTSVRYDSLMLAGWIYEDKLKDIDKALVSYTRAIPLLPDRKIGYLRRAHLFSSRGDRHQAAEDLLRAAQRSPTPEDTGQYHWLRAACFGRRFTITNERSDLLEWIAALERSIKEDAPTFSAQSRKWLEVLQHYPAAREKMGMVGPLPDAMDDKLPVVRVYLN